MDVLDFQSREIATISARANMNGVESRLHVHFNLNGDDIETQNKRAI